MKIYINLILCLSFLSISAIDSMQEVQDNITVGTFEGEKVALWIEEFIAPLSPEEVQLVANTLFIFYKQALLQSTLQAQLISLGTHIADIYGSKAEKTLYPGAKRLNDTSLQIKEITFQHDYILRVMDQIMQFWQKTTVYNNAYKALEEIGGIDLTSHADVAQQFAPFLKDDLQVVVPELKKLEKMLLLYSQIYTDIATENVKVESRKEENKPLQDEDVVRTALVMSENLLLEMTRIFEKVLNLYGYNALLGKTSALRYAQWYTAVYDYMIEHDFEKNYFALLFDDKGVISEEKRVYYFPKLKLHNA